MIIVEKEDDILEVEIEDIHEGMIIADEVSDKNGVKFLGSGLKLSSSIVSNLKRNPPVERFLIYKKSIRPVKLTSILEKKEVQMKAALENTYSDCCEIESALDDAVILLKNKIFNIDSPKLISIPSLNRITDIIMDSSKSDGQIIKYIMKIREKDDSLYKHSINVSLLSCMLGKWLGLSGDQLKMLTRSAMLHDIGKIKIDKRILEKPGQLSYDEFAQIKKHPEIGYKMLRDISYMSSDVGMGVLLHHEKEDGSGYPLGLKSSHIHLYAKIISVADIFDALTSNRVYHSGMSPLKVLEIFQRESFGKLDVRCTIKFIRNIADFHEGCKVRLNNSLEGRIIKMNLNNISRPLVLSEGRFIDLQHEGSFEITDIYAD